MLSRERQNQILEALKANQAVRITELTERFQVSVATIRRDLDELEGLGLIERVYGGAVPAEKKPGTRPIFNTRVAQCSAEKAAIGRTAAGLISDGETIVLDIGTTTLEIAKHIKGIANLTVLTNSLPVLNELAGSGVSVYSLGGRLRGQELAFTGSMAEENLNGFFVDKAFIGAGGVTLAGGITDYNPDSAQLCAAIISRARETVLVTDSGKFGKNGFAVVGGLDSVNTIVTDPGVPEEYIKSAAQLGIKLVLAE